jgi:hypothetical protein
VQKLANAEKKTFDLGNELQVRLNEWRVADQRGIRPLSLAATGEAD